MASGLAQTAHVEKIGVDLTGGAKNQGTLKTEGGSTYTCMAFVDTESVTEAVYLFLQEVNTQQSAEILTHVTFVFITPKQIAIESEIAYLLGQLANEKSGEQSLTAQSKQNQSHTPQQTGVPTSPQKGDLTPSAQKHPLLTTTELQKTNALPSPDTVVYSSLFTLVRTVNLAQIKKQEHNKQDVSRDQHDVKKEKESSSLHSATFNSSVEKTLQEKEPNRWDRGDREGNGRQGREDQEEKGHANGEEEKLRQQGIASKKRKGASIESINLPQANRAVESGRIEANTSSNSKVSPAQTLGSVENIYIRFMALMARILSQAEREAHELYVRIKERTDNIDLLTLLLSKVNSEKGAIDWSNDEKMKELIEKARAIGVDIPKDKFKWSEEEKKLLKENIQMRKDSMEKITQLERTDMQRYLQESSQCHQARSNVLKLLKEVTDTILANLRP
jgi:hypothetical protein